MAGITRPRRTAPITRLDTPLERRRRRSRSSVLDKLVNPGSLVSRRGKKDAAKKPRRQTYAPPPVMARGVLEDMAVPTRKRTQPRQRYDVALNIPGAEVRLPSIPRLWIGWRAASGLLAILMALSLYMLLYTPAFQVEVVEVEGLQRLSMEDFNSFLRITGEPIVKVDPEIMHAEIMKEFPELSSIQVKISLPAKVKLEVVERAPIISWVQKSSNGNVEEKWIDEAGIAFEPRGEAGSLIRVESDGTIGADGLTQDPAASKLENTQQDAMAGVPVPMLSNELVSTLQEMGAIIPADTPILFSTEHGFGWNDPNGWQVYFGKSLAEMSQKLLVYQKLVESLEEQGIEPSMISVEFLHAPFYRTER